MTHCSSDTADPDFRGRGLQVQLLSPMKCECWTWPHLSAQIPCCQRGSSTAAAAATEPCYNQQGQEGGDSGGEVEVHEEQDAHRAESERSPRSRLPHMKSYFIATPRNELRYMSVQTEEAGYCGIDHHCVRSNSEALQA